MPGAAARAGTRPAVRADLAAAPALPPRLAARSPRRGHRTGGRGGTPRAPGCPRLWARRNRGSLDEGGSSMPDPASRSQPPAAPGGAVPADPGALAASPAGRPLPWTPGQAGKPRMPGLTGSGANTRGGGSGAARRPAITGQCRHAITPPCASWPAPATSLNSPAASPRRKDGVTHEFSPAPEPGKRNRQAITLRYPQSVPPAHL